MVDIPSSTCRHCGKRGYYSRRAARRRRRQLGGPTLSVYRCRNTPADQDALWHLGHLPAWVKAGGDRSMLPPIRKRIPKRRELRGEWPTEDE